MLSQQPSLPDRTAQRRLLFFVTDHARRDLALRLDAQHHFEVHYITLKHVDHLDLLRDNPWIRPEHVHDLPTLYRTYLKRARHLSFQELTADIVTSEQRYGIRPSSKLINYNYGRSMNPDDDHTSMLARIWAEHAIMRYLKEKIQPDACLGELSRSYMIILYDMCKQDQIPYICPLEFTRSYFGTPLMLNVDDTGYSAELDATYRAYRPRRQQPTPAAGEFADQLPRRIKDREKFSSSLIRANPTYVAQKVKYRINHFRNWLDAFPIDSKYYPETVSHRNPVISIINQFAVKPLKFKVVMHLPWPMLREIPTGEKFIYFPLHYYPEQSSNVWAQDFVHIHDQELQLIQTLSKSIPTGYYLYVKEHYPMIGRRSRNFYNVLNDLYNIRLFWPTVDPFTLIERSDLVITVASTTGIEAYLLGKRVLTFQGSYYRVFDSVNVVDRNIPISQQVAAAMATAAPGACEVRDAAAALYDSACKFTLSSQVIDGWDMVVADESVPAVAEFFQQIIDSQRSHTPD